ncbi:MAG: tetratricopeptide repeat protein [Brevinematia bacterium]
MVSFFNLRVKLVILILLIPIYSFAKSVYSAYISEGMLSYKLGDYDKAIESFEKALELNPNDSLPYRMIGLCYYRKSLFEQALTYLSISLVLENDLNNVTLSIMGNIYFKQRKYNNSVLIYERLSKVTNDAFTHYRLMKSLENIGKLEEAVSVGENFLSSPDWRGFDERTFKLELKSIYLKLSSKYKKIGRENDSRILLEKARNLN